MGYTWWKDNLISAYALSRTDDASVVFSYDALLPKKCTHLCNNIDNKQVVKIVIVQIKEK